MRTPSCAERRGGRHISNSNGTDQPRYRELQPCSVLSDYIQCYWLMTTSGRLLSTVRDRILPDGCMDIIFDFGDRLDLGTVIGTASGGFVVGPMKQPMMADLVGHIEIIGVRFKPGGAYPFFRFPLYEISDRILSLKDLWAHAGGSLQAEIEEGVTIAGKIAILERFLIARAKTAPAVDGAVCAVVAAIFQYRGQLPIDHLGKRIGLGTRQLERRFKTIVGISPKAFSRVIRIRNVISMLRGQCSPDWSDITYRGGFYDQAHFIRDFKALAGLTPSAYMEEQAHVGIVQYTSQSG